VEKETEACLRDGGLPVAPIPEGATVELSIPEGGALKASIPEGGMAARPISVELIPKGSASIPAGSPAAGPMQGGGAPVGNRPEIPEGGTRGRREACQVGVLLGGDLNSDSTDAVLRLLLEVRIYI